MGAVCVQGFIPPLAFLDFQANCLLPIATDIRTLEHIEYTPAPDIVHEAAGHAPILLDKDYRKFLENYAKTARKAIFSHQDIKLYEAIRKLSDLKENPDSHITEISRAEKELKLANQNITWTSEASKIARFYWWTAEYGLIGSIENPQIYGAGLLSSLGEAQSCLLDTTKKIALNLKCLNQSYDITEPQPQLYVVKNFEQLNEMILKIEKKRIDFS